MANLIKLQNAYGANARVLSAAKAMMEELFEGCKARMSISDVGVTSALRVRSLGEMRRTSPICSASSVPARRRRPTRGIGIDRGLVVGMRDRLAALTGSASFSTQVSVRISTQQSALSQIRTIGRTVKSATFTQPFEIESSGVLDECAAKAQLESGNAGLLNTQIGDRYMFSGRAADQPAVASLEDIMDGDGARAGFKQVVSERRQADLGTDGLGRLHISAPTASPVAIAEEIAGTCSASSSRRSRRSMAPRSRDRPARPLASPSNSAGIQIRARRSRFHTTCPTEARNSSR